jgi:predicted CoA-binding protein
MMKNLFSKDASTWPHAVWFQPGADDGNIAKFVREKGIQDRVVMGGACILVSGDGARQELNMDSKGKL